METSKRILIIDFCNYEDYPMGGYLSFAKNLMTSFGNAFALAGITTEKTDPIGKWFIKIIEGIKFDFFAFAFYSDKTAKRFIPDRLAMYYYLRKYQNEILKLRIENVFVQRQEVLMGIKDFGYKNTCYCFAGLENPLAVSKYWYAQYIAKFIERKFFQQLVYVQTILASGDAEAIREMISRSNGMISKDIVNQFPSRINTDIFKPLNKTEARFKLGITTNNILVVTTGRLSWLKGWKFMIDSFKLFEMLKPGSLFYFVGDGEDARKIEEYIHESNLDGKVVMAGRKDLQEVAYYLNASDLFIMGSYKEGWSTSLIEAIACGIPACVTNFSSAKSIIIEGKNGFVISEHDTDLFAQGMIKSSVIPLPVYNENIMPFAVNRLKEELLKYWQLV